MKKILIPLTALLILFVTTSFKPILKKDKNPGVLKADQVFIPVGSTGSKISLQQLSTIHKDDFEALTGKKMNGAERLAFKKSQKMLKKGINNEGEVTSKKLKKMFYADGETGFHLGGFALGFLLGPIGLLIALIINDDNKKNRMRWAWIGFGVYVLVVLILVAAAYGSSFN